MTSECDDVSLWQRAKQLYPRCFLLYLLLLAYLLAGGVLFNLLEFEAREDDVENGTQELDQERNVLISALWAETVAKSEEDWAMIANDRLDLYEGVVKDYLQQGIESEYQHNNEWNIIGSVFYCFTVVTTIGYGSPAPSTSAGKVVTIFYGLFGIPLALIFLSEVGKLLTLLLKSIIKRLSPSSCDESDDFNFGPLLAVGVTFVYLMLGAVFYDWLEEDWNMLDATYFSFITFSTVGFGDLNLQSHSIQLFCMLYTLGALSLCSMCFVVIQQALESFIDNQHHNLSQWWNHKSEQTSAAQHKKNDDDASENMGNQFFVVDQQEQEIEGEIEEEVEDAEIEEEEDEE